MFGQFSVVLERALNASLHNDSSGSSIDVEEKVLYIFMPSVKCMGFDHFCTDKVNSYHIVIIVLSLQFNN